jgi:hypothetical protein
MPHNINTPQLALHAFEVGGPGGLLVAGSKLTVPRTLHVHGKISHGKIGDWVISTLAGPAYILPPEAVAAMLVENVALHTNVLAFFDNVYVV